MDFEHEIEEGPLDAEQIAALAALGIDWARPVTVPQAVPDSL
ncbi:hypothetical protein [Streptomyces olivaceoviridis]